MLGELLGLERGLPVIEAGLEARLDAGLDTGPDAKRTIGLGGQSGRVDRWEQGGRKSDWGAKDDGAVSGMHGYDRRCGGNGGVTGLGSCDTVTLDSLGVIQRIHGLADRAPRSWIEERLARQMVESQRVLM